MTEPQIPLILRESASQVELAEALKVAGNRGVLIVPDELMRQAEDGSAVSIGGFRIVVDDDEESEHPPVSAFSDDLHRWGSNPYVPRAAQRLKEMLGLELYGTERLGRIFRVFEAAGVADYTARDIVSALRDLGVDFLTETEREADRNAEAAREKIRAHIEDVYDVEGSDMATAAEEPVEQRLHRAFLNGYREGSERAQWGTSWDYSR